MQYDDSAYNSTLLGLDIKKHQPESIVPPERQLGVETRTTGYYETASPHSATQLPEGRSSLPFDIGSVGNLSGEYTTNEDGRKSINERFKPSQHVREKPLTVGGVGQGRETCTFDCVNPVVLFMITVDMSAQSTRLRLWVRATFLTVLV